MVINLVLHARFMFTIWRYNDRRYTYISSAKLL